MIPPLLAKIFMVVGAMSTVGVLFLVLASAVAVGIRRRVTRRLHRAREREHEAVRAFGYDLRHAATWFTDDPPTHDALVRFADAAIQTGAIASAQQIRDAWRQANAKHLEQRTNLGTNLYG